MFIHNQTARLFALVFALLLFTAGCRSVSKATISEKEVIGTWTSRCIEAPSSSEIPELAEYAKQGLRYKIAILEDRTCTVRFEFSSSGICFVKGTWKMNKKGQVLVYLPEDDMTMTLAPCAKPKTLQYDNGKGCIFEFTKPLVNTPPALSKAPKRLTKAHLIGYWGKDSIEIKYPPMKDRRANFAVRKADEMITLKQWVGIEFRANGTFEFDSYVSPQKGKWTLDVKTSRILLSFDGIKGDQLELDFNDEYDEIVLRHDPITVTLGKGIVRPPTPKFRDDVR